eukprot:TRINITY_DN384_c0_g1_i4.p1 TRINITY_DN384_c0_g1~~TRINITY_DN384_c0_g1_i4.p1  ORF type:complete len:643 (-),score=175.88 TRINITY_DN384_c0_g1_i4:371-2299(-)
MTHTVHTTDQLRSSDHTRPSPLTQNKKTNSQMESSSPSMSSSMTSKNDFSLETFHSLVFLADLDALRQFCNGFRKRIKSANLAQYIQPNGDNILHVACKADNADVVGFLLSFLPDAVCQELLEHENQDGKAPIDIAKSPEVEALLGIHMKLLEDEFRELHGHSDTTSASDSSAGRFSFSPSIDNWTQGINGKQHLNSNGNSKTESGLLDPTVSDETESSLDKIRLENGQLDLHEHKTSNDTQQSEEQEKTLNRIHDVIESIQDELVEQEIKSGAWDTLMELDGPEFQNIGVVKKIKKQQRKAAKDKKKRRKQEIEAQISSLPSDDSISDVYFGESEPVLFGASKRHRNTMTTTTTTTTTTATTSTPPRAFPNGYRKPSTGSNIRVGQKRHKTDATVQMFMNGNSTTTTTSADDRTVETLDEVEEESNDNNDVSTEINRQQEREQTIRECRICRGGPEDDDDDRELVTPCLCGGTMAFIHRECLARWQQHNPRSPERCEICNETYATKRVVGQHELVHTLWNHYMKRPGKEKTGLFVLCGVILTWASTHLWLYMFFGPTLYRWIAEYRLLNMNVFSLVSAGTLATVSWWWIGQRRGQGLGMVVAGAWVGLGMSFVTGLICKGALYCCKPNCCNMPKGVIDAYF